MKVKTDVEMIGFGREDGGCLGAPFPELSVRMRSFSDLRATSRYLGLTDWHTCKSLYTQSVDMLLFSLTFLILDKEVCHYVI